MANTRLVPLLFLLLSTALTAAEPLRLRPGVPVVVDPSEPGPILRAVEDLRRDLESVLGRSSPRVSELPPDESPGAIVVSCDGDATAAVRDAALRGAEAHAVFVRGSRVVLQGADMRGTIYAIYSFSDRYLDVPPWWFWAEWKPERRSSVELARDTDLRWASPRVAWRGWFPNDQDLQSPWIRKDYHAHWHLLVETMLRLKLNLIDIGETSEDGMRKVRIPRDRGLALTTTHMAPFGASLRNWEKFWARRGESPAPVLNLADITRLEKFWEAHIRLALREKLEMIWMIGFRGDGDKGFYKTFSDAPADPAGRAGTVEEMMRRQVALLRRVTGEEQPPMRTVLYDECSDYVAAGLLRLPEEPGLIWNFVNARRDHFPAPDILQNRAARGRPVGYYFNAQFTETGSHLADGEGPWKMERNFRLVRRAAPDLVLSIINSGNTREFPLTLAAHARMMWDLDAYETGAFVEEFCRRHWGAGFGPEVARLYGDFFDAYWQQRKPDLPDFPRQYVFQDLRVARAPRELLRAADGRVDGKPVLDDREVGYYRITASDSGAPTKTDAVIVGCGAATARFQAVADRCAALSPQLPPQSRAFFDHGLRAQAAFMAAACRCAAAAAQGSKVTANPDAYRKWMTEAQSAVREMGAVLTASSSGRFEGWYGPEEIFKLRETRAMVERRVNGLVPKVRDDPPAAPAQVSPGPGAAVNLK